MSRAWVAALPVAIALLFGADRAALHVASRPDAHGHAAGDLLPDEAARSLHFFPALRALLAQVWLVRIDADLRAGALHKALRHAREALAMTPDLAAVRIRLAYVLAIDLAAHEPDPARRLAWKAEGLAVLDDGIARTPGNPLLHHARGLLLQNRGHYDAEFEAAFRRGNGRGTLEAACDDMLRAAQLDPAGLRFLLDAEVIVGARGDLRLDEALEGRAASLTPALADFERQRDLTLALLRRIDPARREAVDAARIDLEYAEASIELCRLLLRGVEQGALPPEGETRARELLELRDRLKPPAE